MVLCCVRWLVVLLLLSLLSAPVRPSSSPLSPASSAASAAPSSPDARSSSRSSSLVVAVDPLSSLPEEPLSSAETRDGASSVVEGGRLEAQVLLPASSSSSSSSRIISSSSASSLAKSTSSIGSSSSSASSSSPTLSPSSASLQTSSASSQTSLTSSSASSSAGSSRGSSEGSQVEGRKRDRVEPSERSLSSRDKQVLKAVEKSLLGALGLTSRPRRGRVEVEVPPYMWDLYRAQTATASSSTAIRSPFLKGYGSAGVAANTVRSFYHTGHHVTEGCEPGTCARLLFDVTSVPDTETLAAAELRVFIDDQGNHSDLGSSQSQPKVRDRDGQRSRSTRERQQEVVVEVHEIMQTGREEGAEDCITRLLDTRRVRFTHGSSWQSFDIHPAVLKWKRGPAFNKGLEIRLLTARPSDAKHVRVRRWAELSEERWRLERPLLVTYTDDGRGASSKPAPSRSKRAAHSERKRERRRKGRAGKTSKRNRRNRKKKKKKKKKKRTRKGNKNLCQRHALYVDFQEVGWEDWIVAPDGYNAYFCQGECNFPLAQHLNSTNHAIVQTLVNSVDPTAVSKACCVPTELSAISMLYLNERGKVQLKNYQDMKVEACGCR